MSEAEIAKNSNIELPLLKSVTAEDITFITQKIDDEAKEATLYYSINNTSGDVTDAKLNFELLTGAKVIDSSA